MFAKGRSALISSNRMLETAFVIILEACIEIFYNIYEAMSLLYIVAKLNKSLYKFIIIYLGTLFILESGIILLVYIL
jgi:hypothetical protein